ncbi:endonuclease domain-containing protein [Candidatus Uhrbacteria bacterium]|nr:endonuclease domain-containing protein [Candidatus Uhrbacteria bacterium]
MGFPSVSGAVGVANTCTKKIYPELAEAAKRMRDNPTDTEALVWARLSGRQLGHKFRRQHVIDRFIVDFFCLEKSLVVEIDGGIHNQTKDRDAERDRILKVLGCQVLRFSNRQVWDNLDGVIATIRRELDKGIKTKISS